MPAAGPGDITGSGETLNVIIARKKIRSQLRDSIDAISDELADFLYQYFPNITSLQNFVIDDAHPTFPLMKAIESGNIALIQEFWTDLYNILSQSKDAAEKKYLYELFEWSIERMGYNPATPSPIPSASTSSSTPPDHPEAFPKESKEEKAAVEKHQQSLLIFFADQLAALRFLSQAIEDDNEKLVKFIIETIFVATKSSFGSLINGKDILAAYRSKNKEYLKLIERLIGKDDKEKVEIFLTGALKLSKKELLDCFALPLTWSENQVEELFRALDRSRLLTIDEKFILKRIFTETQSLDRKHLIETRWAELTAPSALLNARLFSNIHNDPNLQGTNIQGAYVNRSIEYISRFIERVQDGSLVIPGLNEAEQKQYAENLKPLHEKLQITLSLETKINDFISSLAIKMPLEWANSIKQFNTEMQTIALDHLKQKGSILMPGGWLGLYRKPGHAMLYELKIENGELIFLIHNMGDGIQYHAKRELADKLYYSSVKAYKMKITDAKDLETTLAKLLNELTKPQYSPILGSEFYNGEKLYNSINAVTKELHLAEIDPTPYSKEWTSAQLSGTCGFRIFESYMSNFSYPKGLPYSDLQYEVFRTSIREYFENNKKNLNEGTIQRQMNFALQNFSRLLQDLSERKPPVLNPERIKAGVALVQEVSEALGAAVSTPKMARILPQYVTDLYVRPTPSAASETKAAEIAETRRERKGVERVETLPRINLPALSSSMKSTNPTPVLATLESDTPFQPKLLLTGFNFDPSTEITPVELLAKFSEFVSACETNSRYGYSEFVIRNIESLNIPMDSKYWNVLNPDLLNIWLDNLYKLQTIYQETLRKTNIRPFAEKQNCFMRFAIIANDISSVLFKNNPDLINKLSGFLCMYTYDSYDKSKHSPYFIALNNTNKREVSHITENLQRLHPRWLTDYGSKYKDKDYLYVLVATYDSDEKKKIIEFCKTDIQYKKKNPHDTQPFYAKFPIEDLEKASEDEQALFYSMYLLGQDESQFKEALPILANKLEQVLKINNMAYRAALGVGGNISSYFNCSEYDILELINPLRDIKLNQTKAGPYECVVTDPIPQSYSITSRSMLADTAATIKDPEIRKILETRSESSNTIQTETMGKILNERVNLLRALKNIRLTPNTQITQSIDFMKRSFSKLSDPDLQTFILLNLFEAELLHNQIVLTPATLPDLTAIIRKGILSNIHKKEIKKEALFFLKLSVYLQHFLVNDPKLSSKPIAQKIIKDLVDINSQIAEYLKICAQEKEAAGDDAAKNEALEDMMMQLNSVNIVYAATDAPKILSSSELFKLLSSYLYTKNNKKPSFPDPFLDHMAESLTAENQLNIEASLKKLVSENISEYEKLLYDLASLQGIQDFGLKPGESAHWDTKLDYPWVRLIADKDNRVFVSMNLATGKIFTETKEKILIPDYVYQSQVFARLFDVRNLFAFASRDQNVFEFQQNKVNYRFIRYVGPGFFNEDGAIQREISIAGKKEWYEYCYISTTDKNPLPDLPKVLLDDDHQIWMNLNKDEKGQRILLILDKKTQKPTFQYSEEKLWTLNPDGSKSDFYLLNNDSTNLLISQFKALSNFEDSQFMIISKRNVSGEIHIELPRYGISFHATVSKEGHVGDLIYQADPRYKLKLDFDQNSIPNFRNGLCLTSLEKTASLPDKVLIPEKLFTATNDAEGEYYRLQYDSSDSVITNLLKNSGQYHDGDETRTCWSQSEHFETYTVPPTGLGLKPSTPHGRLHLAYLYLSKRQPLLAFDALQAAIKEGAALTKEDIMTLRNIIYEIPAKLQSRGAALTTEQEAGINTPEFVAIQALAFSLLVTQKLDERGVKIPLAEKPRRPNMHSEYGTFRNTQLREFWKNKALSASILAHMQDYLKKVQYMPVELKLNETQELEMLRYVMYHQKEIPPNIRFRRRVLELNQLTRERSRLESIKLSQGGKLSHALTIKLNQLNERIQNYPEVAVLMPDLKTIEGVAGVAAIPVFIPVPKPAIKEETLAKPAPISEKSILETEQKRFQELYAKTEKELKNKVDFKKEREKLFKPRPELKGALALLYEEDQTEYEHGLENNLKIKARQIAAQRFYDQALATGESRIALTSNIMKSIQSGDEALQELRDAILSFANKEPSDPTKRGEWALKKVALQIRDLSFEQILRLYLKRDQSLYAAMTALNEKEMHELQQKIYEYLLKASEIQYLKRIYSPVEIDHATGQVKMATGPLAILNKKDASPEELKAAKEQLGMLLSMQRCYKADEHPEILLFEYLENKLIYPEQYQYLDSLMKRKDEGFTSQIIKLIMGGGKSKVLLPMLALEKATGSNLVVMEVPEALYEINKADLNATTQRLFGCNAHPFYFDESVKCTSRYLLNLKRNLKTVMQNREYLVTTKESLQALELKYLKILRYGDMKDKKTRRILKHLSDILRLFKNQGDFLIDEVDSTLDIRKQLIYTVGKTRRLPNSIVNVGYDFFQFLDTITINLGKREQETITLKQIITREKTPSEKQWLFVQEGFVDALLHDKNSPLRQLFNENTLTKEGMALKAYLLGRTKSIPNCVLKLPAEGKEVIAFYKLEFESLLTLTLGKKKNVRYGHTKDPKKPIEIQDIAIPYAASDIADENSRFKNPIETLNFTILMHYGEPVSLNTFKQMLRQFKIEQEEEAKLGLVRGRESAYDRFFKLTGASLDAIEIENSTVIENLYKENRMKSDVKRYCMVNHILCNIEENEEYLASDAHNHCGQGRSIQGMTGTDWNKRCLPKSIETKQALSGSDGQVMDYLERGKTPPHLLKEACKNTFETVSAVTHLFVENPQKEKFHAWIDLGAHFRGVPNHKVAFAFGKYFASRDEFQHLKYVLFFDPDGKLYAHPVGGGNNIYLEETSPEYIKTHLFDPKTGLGIDPEQYFVYYDQRRTTGTDIKLAKDARAFVSVGSDTLKRDLLQAVMRMRELGAEQRVEFVIPKECQDVHPEIKVADWQVSTIIEMCRENEDNRLVEDHFRAAQQEMKQFVRNDLLTRIYATQDVDEQHRLIEKFHQAFFNKIESSLFALYGGVKEEKEVRKVLQEQAKMLIGNWRSMLKEANMEPTGAEITTFIKNMYSIMNAAVPISPVTVEVSSEQTALKTPEFEAEVQVETTETAEKTEEQELDYAEVSEATAAQLFPLDNFFFLSDVTTAHQNGCLTLEELAQAAAMKTKSGNTRVEKRDWQFSDHIFVSGGFARTLKVQPNLMDAYLKESVFYLVQYDPNNIKDPIRKLLITPEEAAHFSPTVSDLAAKQAGDPTAMQYWIETPHNTLHAGQKPAVLPPEYDYLGEQIRAFNGDMDLIYQNLDKDSWFGTKPLSKLQYLERVIQPLHRDKANLIKPIRNRIAELFDISKELRFSEAAPAPKYEDLIPEAPSPRTEDRKPEAPTPKLEDLIEPEAPTPTLTDMEPEKFEEAMPTGREKIIRPRWIEDFSGTEGIPTSPKPFQSEVEGVPTSPKPFKKEILHAFGTREDQRPSPPKGPKEGPKEGPKTSPKRGPKTGPSAGS